MRYPDTLLQLILILKRLPGVGSKSAERFAFELLQWSNEKIFELSSTLAELKKKLKPCDVCGSLMEHEPCSMCDTNRRDSSTICIVASIKDVFLIEETHEFKGLYHVLGTLLHPLHHESINLNQLTQRIEKNAIQEVIIALDSTLEGDATSLYVKKALEKYQLRVSRLALGMPMGSPLDFIDGGTLARAFAGRRTY